MKYILTSILFLSLLSIGVQGSDGPAPEPPAMPDDGSDLHGPPQNHHGGRGGGKCFDKKNSNYCDWVSSRGKCEKRNYYKNCRKTCKICVEKECKDTASFCGIQNAENCRWGWFYSGCRKSCGLCTTGETTESPTTEVTATVEECQDTGIGCELADEFRCQLFRYIVGCRKSCGLCESEESTTPTPETRPSTMPPVTATESTTSTTTEGSPETAPPTPTSECADSSKMCPIWKDTELCDNEEFEAEMRELCPLSCGICIERGD